MSEEERVIKSKRLLEGIRKAQLRMFERKAKLGESVVLADRNGKPYVISAEEALRRFSPAVAAD